MPYPAPEQAHHDPVESRRIGRRVVVSVHGEIDFATVPRMRRVLDEAVRAGAMEVWVDLGGVTFMDSSGAHWLADAHAALGALNRRLVVICGEGQPGRLLDLLAVPLVVLASRGDAQRAAA